MSNDSQPETTNNEAKYRLHHINSSGESRFVSEQLYTEAEAQRACESANLIEQRPTARGATLGWRWEYRLAEMGTMDSDNPQSTQCRCADECVWDESQWHLLHHPDCPVMKERSFAHAKSPEPRLWFPESRITWHTNPTPLPLPIGTRLRDVATNQWYKWDGAQWQKEPSGDDLPTYGTKAELPSLPEGERWKLVAAGDVEALRERAAMLIADGQRVAMVVWDDWDRCPTLHVVAKQRSITPPQSNA